MMKRTALLLSSICLLWTSAETRAATGQPWWPETTAARLSAAGTNQTQLLDALNQVPEGRREGLRFLIENMPPQDLQSLSASFLLEDLGLAYEAWESAPWRSQLTPELFYNEILPYACFNETREPWRAKLRQICAPMVVGCKTPGEAAQVLNQKFFPAVKVGYNTKRRRTCQSPSETLETGMATCTGLSILLVDACRSVGIPARVVGTPLWSNLRGNHTWVEVWDGDWHFMGAAEPDPAGLDRGWFVHDASLAKRDEPRHAIYATSFRQTGLPFPMVWARQDTSVPAVNVTDRYAKPPAAATATVRINVRVLDGAGKRVVADLTVTSAADAAAVLRDKSRSETNDLNDFAAFDLVRGQVYQVKATLDGHTVESNVTAQEANQVVTLTLPGN